MEYNKNTILDGKHVELNEEERDGVEKFHLSRIAFAILQDGTIATNVNDVREHRVYLEEDFGITSESFEELVRGYIKGDRIVIYVSSSFKEVPTGTVIPGVELYSMACKFFGDGPYPLWNGVSVGKLGEEWPPIKIIGEMSSSQVINVIP